MNTKQKEKTKVLKKTRKINSSWKKVTRKYHKSTTFHWFITPTIHRGRCKTTLSTRSTMHFPTPPHPPDRYSAIGKTVVPWPRGGGGPLNPRSGDLTRSNCAKRRGHSAVDDKLKGRENTKSATDRRGKRLAFFLPEKNKREKRWRWLLRYHGIFAKKKKKKDLRIKIIPFFYTYKSERDYWQSLQF